MVKFGYSFLAEIFLFEEADASGKLTIDAICLSNEEGLQEKRPWNHPKFHEK